MKCGTRIISLFISFLIIWLSEGTVSAEIALINVTHPAKGTTLNQGATYPIHWDVVDTSGKITTHYWVKIELLPQGQQGHARVIAESAFLSDSVSVNWTVPSDVPPGNYVVRVRERDTSRYGDSGVFVITSAPLEIKRGVTKPVERPGGAIGGSLERTANAHQQAQGVQKAPGTIVDKKPPVSVYPEMIPADKVRIPAPDLAVTAFSYDVLEWGPVMAGTKVEEKWGKIRMRATIRNLGDTLDSPGFGASIVLFGLPPQASPGYPGVSPPANSIVKTQKINKIISGLIVEFVHEPLLYYCANPKDLYVRVVYDPVLPVNKSKHEVDKDWYNNEKVIKAQDLQESLCGK